MMARVRQVVRCGTATGRNHLGGVLALSVSLLGWACGQLCADDIEVNDLRISAGELSTHFKEASPQAATANGPVDFTQARNASTDRREALSIRHIAFGDGGGLIWGIEVGIDQLDFSDSDHSNDFTVVQADALIGYALRLTDGWHLEAEICGGTGRLSSDGLKLKALRSGNAYFEYGAQLGAFYTLPDGLQFGLELPYLITRVHPTYSYVQNDGSVVSVTENRRSIGGFSWLASVGIRF